MRGKAQAVVPKDRGIQLRQPAPPYSVFGPALQGLDDPMELGANQRAKPSGRRRHAHRAFTHAHRMFGLELVPEAAYLFSQRGVVCEHGSTPAC